MESLMIWILRTKISDCDLIPIPNLTMISDSGKRMMTNKVEIKLKFIHA